MWVKVWVDVDKRGYLCGNPCVSIVGNFDLYEVLAIKAQVKAAQSLGKGVEKDNSLSLTI